MAGVILKHLVKQFKSVTAVDNLSIEIQDKEFAVLVGPSGCGKTTALRMIAGLEEISSGRIRIGGEEWSSRPYDESLVIPVGAKVDVMQIEGATALVYPRE